MLSTRTLRRFAHPRSELPFIFKSYIRLADDLGRVDALASAIMLSTRHFEAAASSAKDKQMYALAEAARFRVGTRYVSFGDLPSHTSQLLLVGVYQQAEGFFTGFKQEMDLFGRKWRQRSDGESRLRFILDCLGPSFATNVNAVGVERFYLFEYYRTLRNGFVHLNIARARLDREFEQVIGFRGIVANEFKLNAPNPYDKLTYDDFLLFTRLAKYFASDFCYLGTPTDQELLSLLENMEKGDLKPLTEFRARRGTVSQARSAIRRWFLSHYRLNLVNRPEAERVILDRVMAMPNKKERRRVKRNGGQ